MVTMKDVSLVKYLVTREVGSSRGYEHVQEYGSGTVSQQVTEEKATIPSKNQACEFSGQTRSTFLMAFSPDGTLMASTHGDHAVRVSDLSSGKCLHTLNGHPRTPWCVAFHPVSNDILASGCLGGEVRIWDLRGGGSEVWRSEKNVSIASIAFHPSDQVLVFAVSNEVHFWDWTQPQPFTTISTSYEYEKVRWVRFDPYGYHLFTGIGNGVSVQATGEDADVSHMGHTFGRHTAEERAQLQNQYRRILSEIHQLRRDRLHSEAQGGAQRTGEAAAAADSLAPDPEPQPTEAAGAESSTTGSRPPSPAHVDALVNARLYASAVTRAQQARVQQAASRYQTSEQAMGGDQDSQQTEGSNQDSQEATGIEQAEGSNQDSQQIIGSNLSSGQAEGSSRNSQQLAGRYPYSQHAVESNRNSHQAGTGGRYRYSQRRSLLQHLKDIRQDGANRRAVSQAAANQDPTRPSGVGTIEPNMPVISTTAGTRVQVTSSMLSSFLRSQLTSSAQSLGASTTTTISLSTSASTIPTSNTIQPVRVLSVTPAPTRGAPTPQGTAVSVRAQLASAFRARSQATATSTATTTSASTSGVTGSIRGRFINYLNSTASIGVAREEHHQCSTGQCPVCQRYPSLAATQGSSWSPRTVPILPRRISRSTSGRDDAIGRRTKQNPRKMASVLETEVKKALDQVRARRLDISETLRDLENLRQELGSHRCGGPTGTPGADSEAGGVGNVEGTAMDASVADGIARLIEGADDADGTASVVERVCDADGTARLTEGSNDADGTARLLEGSNDADGTARLLEGSNDADGTARLTERLGDAGGTVRLTVGLSNADGTAMLPQVKRSNLSTLNYEGDSLPGTSLTGSTSSTPHMDSRPGPSRPHYSFDPDEDEFPLTSSQESTISELSTEPDSSLSDLLLAPATDPQPLEVCPENVTALPMRQTSVSSTEGADTMELDNSSQGSSSSTSSLGSMDSLPSSQEDNGGSPRAEATLNAIGQYSSEIERRVQELDSRISEIQNRLQTRLQTLQQHRERQPNKTSSHTVPRCVSVSERIRQRHDRLRAHLADLQTRYRRRIRHSRERRLGLSQEPRSGQEPRSSQEVRSGQETRSSQEREDQTPALNSQVSERNAAPASVSSTSLRGVRSITSSRRLWTENVTDTISNMRAEMARNRQSRRENYRSWHSLQRRHLHPHYSVSILDETVNRPEEGLQTAISRAIAGAFVSSGEPSVASNILNASYRIQRWAFSRGNIPDIKNSEENVIVPHCKLHNDAYCDISKDGRFLAVFVPSHNGFPDDSVLAIYSLAQDTFKQCLYTKSFGPNFVSVSISPLNNYILVGLATRRLAWVFAPRQMVAQVYKVKTPQAGEDSMEHVCDLMHPCDMDIRTPVSVNSARWLPYVGEGIVYGTNRGDLHICRPGFEQEEKRNTENDGQQESHNVRPTWMMHMLGLNVPRTTSTSTQTIQRVRRTASTQTDRIETDDAT